MHPQSKNLASGKGNLKYSFKHNLRSYFKRPQPSVLNVLFLVFCTFLFSCSSKPGSDKDSSTKFQQYYVKGEQLYLEHCSNCHQKNGTGLGLLYPPLNRSDFMTTHVDEVLCLMKYGKQGELTVNGKSFNKEMPGIATLTDLEVAEIATYIYNTWEHQHGLIDVKDATKALSNCK